MEPPENLKDIVGTKFHAWDFMHEKPTGTETYRTTVPPKHPAESPKKLPPSPVEHQSSPVLLEDEISLEVDIYEPGVTL